MRHNREAFHEYRCSVELVIDDIQGRKNTLVIQFNNSFRVVILKETHAWLESLWDDILFLVFRKFNSST